MRTGIFLVFFGLLARGAVAAAIAIELPTATLVTRAEPVFHKPYNVDAPGPTPAFVHPALPILLPVEQVVSLITATTALATSILGQAAAQLIGTVQGVVGIVNGLLCGLFPCPPPPPPPPPPTNVPCLNSTYDERTINSLFQCKYLGAS